MSEEAARLADDLVAVYDESPWHGPSFRAALSRLTAAHAAASTVPDGTWVWEFIQHATAWRANSAHRLDTGASVSLEGTDDCPPVPSPTDEEAGARALGALDDAYHDLFAHMGVLAAGDFNRPIAGTTTGARGGTVAELASGLTQLLAYHSGRLALLRRTRDRP